MLLLNIRITGIFMKAKLNLKIDEELVPKLKAYARLHGKSVSQLVEDLLRKVTRSEKDLFTKRWRGKFNVSENDDPRFQKLKQRYLS
jgi:hypothetical protein